MQSKTHFKQNLSLTIWIVGLEAYKVIQDSGYNHLKGSKRIKAFFFFKTHCI